MNRYNYTGKTVFVGIDVHKKTYSCTAMCEGQIVKQDRMGADQVSLIAYLQNTFKGAEIKTAYEAGFSGFHLHRELKKKGIDNQVVHPGSIEVASRDRVKTDKRDSKKIAIQLMNQRLTGIYVPEVAQESRRSVTRLRTHIQKLRHQIGQQLKSLLFTQGLIASDDDTRLSSQWIKHKVEAIKIGDYAEDFIYTVTQYHEQWESLNQRLKTITQRLKQQAEADGGLQLIYESVPGIGLLHARELANELGDMKQFSNEKKLFSFIGLTPTEHSSGEQTRQGHISRQGRSILRKIFIESAWVAITKDPSLEEVYQRLTASRGKKRAIVGVARRLAGRIRSCIINGTLYEIRNVNLLKGTEKKTVTA